MFIHTYDTHTYDTWHLVPLSVDISLFTKKDHQSIGRYLSN